MKRTQVVDGSNESLFHADEEMHPLARTFPPSQTIFKNLDVKEAAHMYNAASVVHYRKDNTILVMISQ